MKGLVRTEFRVYVMYRKMRGRMQGMHDSRVYIRYVHLCFHFCGAPTPRSDTRTLTKKRSLACECHHVGVPFTSMEAGS